MPVEIHVPELGESVADATVGKWLKQEGDAVKVSEGLVVVSASNEGSETR